MKINKGAIFKAINEQTYRVLSLDNWPSIKALRMDEKRPNITTVKADQVTEIIEPGKYSTEFKTINQ